LSNWAIILPFIRPLEPLLLDPTVTEVMVNAGGRSIFVERAGRLERVPDLALEPKNLRTAVVNIARLCNDDISEAQPSLDARLEDGSRIAAMFAPCSPDGTTLTIRKFGQRYSLDELVTAGSVSSGCATRLVSAVRGQQNILISGGTGSGKTTMLNALADHIPASDRIVLIEDTSEIHIDERRHHVLRFEARRKQVPLGQEEPLPAVTVADLLRSTLRHRPDRIILGEVRGGEAWDLIQSLNTGHGGSLSTIHANSAPQAVTRLAHLVLMAEMGLPIASVKEAIALAVHLVAHIARREDGRRQVTQLAAIRGFNGGTDVEFEVLYEAPREIGVMA
jgi:pilus assembly protein CpaF